MQSRKKTNSMQPFQQGQLDNWCGLYALINASRLAMPSIEDEECEEIFQEAFAWIYQNWRPYMSDGLNLNVLLRLHKAVFRPRWPISLHLPFRSKPPKNTEDFWQRMEYEASRQDQCIFIGLENESEDLSHWSVVRKITPKKVILFDSYKLSFLKRHQSGYKENSRKGVKTVIGPGYVLVLRKNVRKRADSPLKKS